MKKQTQVKEISAAKKSAKVEQVAATASAQPTTPSSARKPLVAKQPRSTKDAAVQAGMFLHTDDNWSTAYFNSSDLHCMERELFG
jgi:hypothetical protein